MGPDQKVKKNIARIAKLPQLLSELKKMSFLSGRRVRQVSQEGWSVGKNNNKKQQTTKQQQQNKKTITTTTATKQQQQKIITNNNNKTTSTTKLDIQQREHL